MTDEQVVENHDVNHTNVNWGQRDWQMEMARRDAARQGDRIEAMTRTMHNLTWVMTFVAIASLASAVAAAYFSWKAS